MSKVTVVQVIYNSKRFIEPVFEAIFKQTYKDFNVVVVIAGNEDGGKELLQQKFPQVEIIDPGYNIGFAKGHNLVFDRYASDFFQLVNPDLIMEPDYIEQMLKAFEDPKVGAATGKLFKIPADAFTFSAEQFNSHKATFKTLDTTGITIHKSGHMRDRGQHEIDNGQYDNSKVVKSVCAAGAMYRKSALGFVKYKNEYFDEDFHSYWEDVDLGWRITNSGLKCLYQPSAVSYHGRGTPSTIGGYKKVFAFIKQHRKINIWIRRQNYKNHFFTYLKNSPYFYPSFFVREFFMFVYLLIFETPVLKVLPKFFKLLPKMWEKRKHIKQQASS